MLIFYPDTLNKPLEEVAALFGDHDLVALYSNNITLESEKSVPEVRELEDKSSE